MNRLHIKSLVIGILCLFPSLATAVTVDSPHDTANGYSCASCHTLHLDLGSTGYNNVCLNCHRPGVPKAGNKPFTPADFANPFNTYTATRTGTLYQTSHNWNGPDEVDEAGAQPPQFAAMTSTGTGNKLRARTGGSLACVRCHNQHDNTNKPFLRMANDRDQMCLDCHRSRNQQSHTTGTHPVNFNYTGATSKVKTNPAQFNNPPVNANTTNPTSDLNARLTRTGGSLVCSTCHGVHYSDSSSATFDNNSGFNALKPSDGSLLRTDLHGANADDLNICTNCHAGKVAHNGRNQNIQCADCHGGHVDFDPNAVTAQQRIPNVWLVRRYMNVSTVLRSAKNKPVYFQSTTVKNYKDASGNGVCQSCHDVPVGSGYPDEHARLDTTTCNACHFHGNTKGSFTAIGACNTCHGYPPHGNSAGGPNGYAVFNGTPSPFTNESSSAHITHSGGIVYSKQCVDCHQGNTHQAGTFQDVFIDTTGRIASSFGATPTFNGTPATAPTCSNVYCHSDGAPRNASLVPVLTTKTIPGWANGRGAIVGQPDECRQCHGDATTLATNSHGKHLADSIGCTVCHNGTVSSNNAIKDFNTHANGVKDVRFGGTLTTGGTWTVSAATCSGIYCHSNVQGANGNGAPTAFASPVWGSVTITCGSCHVDMSSSASATGSHIKHAQATGIACSICHNGAGAGTALHANGVIENSFSGPSATGTIYSQANLPAGNGYGSCSNSYCHSNVQGTNGIGAPTQNGTPTWGGLFPCGSCHVKMDTDVSAPGSHVAHANTTGSGNGRLPCSTCHSGAGSGTTNHANQVINLAFTGSAVNTVYSLGNNVAPGSGYGSCSATYCHGSAAPTWGGAHLVCNSCHGASNNGDLSAGATGHAIHYNSAAVFSSITGSNAHTSSAYAYGCKNCHPTNSHANGPATANRAAEVGGLKITAYTEAGTPATDPKGMKYTTAGTCTTVCHTDGNGGAPKVAVNWGTAQVGGSNCGVCHNKQGDASPTWSAPHTKHVNTYTFTCRNCHFGTASDNATINGASGKNQHPNGVKDVAFSYNAILRTTWSSTGTQCINTYCHSDGAVFATPTHGTLSWTTPPSINCGSCHGGGTASGSPTAVSKANSHAKHTGNNINSCYQCHNSVVNNAGAIINPTLHVNQAYNIQQSGGSVTFTLARQGTDTTATQCSTVSCHGGGGSPTTVTWGTTLNCQDCHGDTADFDVFTIPFTNVTSTPFNTSSPVAKINMTEWTTTGHGKTSGTYASGNGAAALVVVNACEYCHDPAISHNAAANPFRLRGNTGGTGWGLNDACMNCHKTDAVGVTVTIGGALKTSGKKVGAVHNGTSHSFGFKSGGLFCWDCHDGHGDTNAYMIHKKVVKNSSVFDPSTGYLPTAGVPTEFAAPKDPVFTLSSNPPIGGDYVKADFTGICQVCHGSGVSHYNINSYDTTHNINTRCTICHTHDGDAPTTNNKAFSFTRHSYPAYYGHKTDSGASPFPSCVTTGCHSNTKTTGYPVTSGNPPDCQGCHTKAAPGIGCGSCHGGADGRPTGTVFPDIQNGHSRSDHQVTCATCHGTAGSPQDAHGPGNRVTHTDADVIINFSGDGAGMNFTRLGNGSGSCTGTCHSKNHSSDSW
ncbi:CxxxxCH/CxxCH domain c-type cytochrome [Geotalea uraniireducens]|uniref:Cytochrome C family protein n=1 Tax=Geotalea uraniireducens (strain Rf4) TaxID=351605 RepID=A5GF19_GEOUR|nr:CxxxxCH/CxxCH domain-containing protein [Geotalea uraniireducens]ABQ26024.1 cytochrome C family protein [Geotalea uraniireducens Rf4]